MIPLLEWPRVEELLPITLLGDLARGYERLGLAAIDGVLRLHRPCPDRLQSAKHLDRGPCSPVTKSVKFLIQMIGLSNKLTRESESCSRPREVAPMERLLPSSWWLVTETSPGAKPLRAGIPVIHINWVGKDETTAEENESEFGKRATVEYEHGG